MQSETEEEIYNAALDLIEELKLDEGEWLKLVANGINKFIIKEKIAIIHSL